METNRSTYEVQLSSSRATGGKLPRRVRESCRRSLAALKAALESGALERALDGDAAGNPTPVSRPG